ncbi:hypothetical protein Poli38472_006624 [Pythium oligandrum]|uniref:Cyclin-like domain-containing protein n=1 Tax=Pythium oligandrum TaxID=41045 RepID=A0A8K1C540_PYTOL|nr:hypothetical protein Poli38472_006624 [Pythium oligandrum]|eukprot:TMW56614.1 hypothetical protein Poli38472_006624 [Pythium oligandrum]
MAYLQTSTHFNNWVFQADELARVDRLRVLKAKKALRLEREASAAAAASATTEGSASANNGLKTTRKARSFAALVPASSTASRDIYDWNDEIDMPLEQAEEAEEKDGLKLTPLIEYLSVEQERLVREYYESKVQESCSQLFRTSDKVKCSAVMLFKRFYLSNSVMEFHPKYIVPTAIYVAGKVEEQYINVDTIADQLKVDHKHVIDHEMILLEGVRFQLIMYHPFRALLGFVDDFRGFSKAQGRDLPLEALQKLHANSCVVVNELLLTELPLVHYPAYLALAALCHVAEELERETPALKVTKADALEYIKRSKFAQGQDVAKVYGTLETITQRHQAFKTQKAHEQTPGEAEKLAKQIKKLYKKLKKFHVEDGDGKKDDKESKKRKSDDKKDEKKKSKKHKKDKK